MEKMKELEEKTRECKRCKLHEDRTNAVPGEGSYEAGIMFIGEAPGRQEDLEGRPFVGRAGDILDDLLEKIGLERNEVYIANILKCRPPRNRDPKKEEIKKCTPYLDKQIQLLDPRIIVPLGNFAAKYILEKYNFEKKSIGKVHGEVYEVSNLKGRVTIVPQYHPAAATYDPSKKDVLEEDFKGVERKIEEIK
ncbi:MAG: type-4 uracil-DNA glycosylase [Candidatus Aenigmatarchaeota archaeon]